MESHTIIGCYSKTFVLILMLMMTPKLPVFVYRIYKRNCARVCAYVFYSSKSCKINSLTDRIFSRRDKKRGAIIIFLHFVCARIYYTTACIRLSISHPSAQKKQKKILQFMLSFFMHIHYCSLACFSALKPKRARIHISHFS